jgi:hypothetical protein
MYHERLAVVSSLYEYHENVVWIKTYPISYAATHFDSRMTIIRLSGGGLVIHSPCEIDNKTKNEINDLGEVDFIFAPGSYHYLYISSAQKAFPCAKTYICPGIEMKLPRLDFDGFLSDIPIDPLQNDFEQVLVRGNSLMWEVAFFHKDTKILILVDLIENFTDKTNNVNWVLKLWWKIIFRMWDNPKPAPEYQLGWKDKTAASKSLAKILSWDFDSIILSHGELIENNAKKVATKAWKQLIQY